MEEEELTEEEWDDLLQRAVESPKFQAMAAQALKDFKEGRTLPLPGETEDFQRMVANPPGSDGTS